MALNTRDEAVERAVKDLFDEEAATGGSDPYCYSITVSAAFEKIALLREKGMRFEKICAAFAKTGLLPCGAKPHSLSQAFLREKRKREKTARAADAGMAEKASAAEIAETDRTAKFSQKPEQAEPVFGASRAPSMEKGKAEERAKTLTGSTEETTLGKLTKHSDGSFDFDWKN
jgi:hypothetical protein